MEILERHIPQVIEEPYRSRGKKYSVGNKPNWVVWNMLGAAWGALTARNLASDPREFSPVHPAIPGVLASLFGLNAFRRAFELKLRSIPDGEFGCQSNLNCSMSVG